MWNFSKESLPVARKDYKCQAWDWIVNAIETDDLSDEEQAIIKKAEGEGFKILKGTKYLRVDGMWEGEFTTYCARLDLQKICDGHEVQLD